MRTIYKVNVFLIVSFIFCAGCTNPVSVEKVTFRADTAIDDFITMVDYIDAVPLEDDGCHYVGSMPELHLCGADYIIVDKFNQLVYRYSESGGFLNEIGKKGNGPQEFLTVDNIQVFDNGTVNIYSRPDMVLTYSANGDFLSVAQIKDRGLQSFIVNGGVLTYYGNGTGRKSRLSYFKDDTSETLLSGIDNVMNFTSQTPIFSTLSDNSVSVLDSYSPIIYRYDGEKLSPYIELDFMNTSVPDTYYAQDDPFSASDMLLSRKFSMIRRYFENGNYRFVETYTNNPDSMPDFKYAIYRGDEWTWFDVGEPAVSPLVSSFMCFDDDATLYAIIDPVYMATCPQEIIDKIRNKETINSINEEDNHIILKIKLF